MTEPATEPARAPEAKPDKGIGVREVTQTGFQSGFCGGSMFGNVWVPFAEESHRRCPEHSAGSSKRDPMACVCPCHSGAEPWAGRDRTIFEIGNGLKVTAKGAPAPPDAKPIRKRRAPARAGK